MNAEQLKATLALLGWQPALLWGGTWVLTNPSRGIMMSYAMGRLIRSSRIVFPAVEYREWDVTAPGYEELMRLCIEVYKWETRS